MNLHDVRSGRCRLAETIVVDPSLDSDVRDGLLLKIALLGIPARLPKQRPVEWR
jgi:hypothetical protein